MPEIVINWPLIVACCAFMVLDLITGFIGAVVHNEVQSSKMKAGLWHKCGFLLAIMFGVLCEWASSFIDLGFSLPVQPAVCVFIILIEVMSNLENLCKISPELKCSKFMQIFASDKLEPVENDNLV